MVSRGKSGALRKLGVALVGAAAVATFAAAPGCADDNTMVYVRAVVPPTKGCSYDGTVDANIVTISWGALDWSCKKEYSANILVANALQRNSSNEQRRTEANRLQVETLEVTAVFPGGTTLAYDLPATAVVEPADGTTPGYAIVGVPLLPLGKLDFARIPGTGPIKQVNFEIRVRGTTLGGRTIVSQPFLFPVRIGEGILRAGGDAAAGGTCAGQDFYYNDPAACPNPSF